MSSSLKSNKYEYQHCISSTNGSISVDIGIFWGARFKKAPEAVGKWNPLRKKNGFPIFLAKGKNLTLRQVEIPKCPKKGQPYRLCFKSFVCALVLEFYLETLISICFHIVH